MEATVNLVLNVGCFKHGGWLFIPISFVELFAYFFLAFCQIFVDIFIHSKRPFNLVYFVVVNLLYLLLIGVSRILSHFYYLSHACFGINLMVPYYLLCILSLIVFIITQGHLPSPNFGNILCWLQIRPTQMPFPIGQVWFLNTLFIIFLFSPLYFRLYKGNKYLLLLVMIRASEKLISTIP